MDFLIQAFTYVISAPYFWLSMGMTTAIAIFVGAMIYDGDLPTATKGLVSVGLYAFFIFQTSYTRISNNLYLHPEISEPTRYGGLLTIIIVTIFWILGVFLGVTTSWLVRTKQLQWFFNLTGKIFRMV